MIGHLENVNSVNSTDLLNAGILHYAITKNSLISPLLLSVKQFFIFTVSMWQKYAMTGAKICASIQAVSPTVGFVPVANVNPVGNANNIFMSSQK